jgi:hypothetical protein
LSRLSFRHPGEKSKCIGAIFYIGLRKLVPKALSLFAVMAKRQLAMDGGRTITPWTAVTTAEQLQ